MKSVVSAIIPAAGMSRRMGQPKQLLPINGRPMVKFAAERLFQAGIRDVVVVLGSFHARVFECIKDMGLKTALNTISGSQMVESVRFGMENISSRSSGVLIMPVDSCFASVDTLKALIDLHLEHPDRLIRPHSGLRGGHPLIVPKRYFARVRTPGLKSLRQLIGQERDFLINMPCKDKGAFVDLDTPEDYEKVLGTRLHDARRRG